MTSIVIHPTADVSSLAEIGTGTKIWHQAQVRERARIGTECIVGKGAYIDFDVVIGNNVKIQNRASIYHPAVIEDGVFIGPHVILTNDRAPRAINPDGSLKSDADWVAERIEIRFGASLGAGSIVLPGVSVGRFALVAAGAVVTRDVPDYGLIVGVPGRQIGYVCACGKRLMFEGQEAICPECGRRYRFRDDQLHQVDV